MKKKPSKKPIPPEVEAFIESTIQGLKQVELYEKGLIQLRTARQMIEELEKEIENNFGK